jgi:hypothetical protein
MGALHSVCVGVSKYPQTSGHSTLKQSINDAAQVKATLNSVPQLGATSGQHVVLVSDGVTEPSRGHIINSARALATLAGPDERILFYFSGHGQRINKELYLVPGDAWTGDDPAALVSFTQVCQTLDASQARQKFLIIDACWSGPDTTSLKKVRAAEVSAKFLANYIAETKGTVILASSSGEQESWAKSPDPKLSLFTHFLIKALNGTPEALDSGRFLTFSSLYDYASVEVQRSSKSYHQLQQPTIRSTTTNTLILGDFRHLFSADTLIPSRDTIAHLEFQDRSERVVAKDILPDSKRWRGAEYIEMRINSSLGDIYRSELGTVAASIRKALHYPPNSVSASAESVDFPGGAYVLSYESSDERHGHLIRTVTFDADWFGRHEDILAILDAVDLQPTEMVFQLVGNAEPLKFIPGLEAQNWVLTLELDECIEAERDGYKLRIEEGRIKMYGFAPSELLGKDADKAKLKLAASVVALLDA